ncbi:MAG: YdcF family protein [Oscillatoriales cyanobacterium C42_A2020_001]|nr:YdcF family protein [Leptolyngbyaceae cyanobacterium C42_A2020_001]
MVLLLTDVFLLLTQILLWIVVGLVIWYFLSKILDRKFLGLLVLLLFLAVIILAFFRGGIDEPGSILELLWRVLSFPLTPFGLGLILLFLLITGKVAKLARRIVIAVLILLALGSIPLVAYFLAQELEMEAIELIAPAPPLEAGSRQVIVLLGKGTTRTQLRPRVNPPPTDAPPVERAITPEQFDVLGNLHVQVTEHGDRIIYAAQLYREETGRGTNPLIVVSAGRRSDRLQKEGENREDVSEARDIQRLLIQNLGVPEGGILLDHNNGNVRRSAEEVKQLLQNQQVNFGNQIVLVASALNMNRAALTFREVFNESRIIARPTDFYTLPQPQRLLQVASGRDLVEREIQITDVLPTADAFYISSQALQEYLNSLYYFLRGWIKPFQAPNLSRPPTTTTNQSPQTVPNQQPLNSEQSPPQPSLPPQGTPPPSLQNASPPQTGTAPPSADEFSGNGGDPYQSPSYGTPPGQRW